MWDVGALHGTDSRPFVGLSTLSSQQLEGRALVPPATGSRTFVLHRLYVAQFRDESGSPEWYLPSANVLLGSFGPQGPAVMKTLAPAGRNARAAPGLVKGHEYLDSVTAAPVTGPDVTLTKVHSNESRNVGIIDSYWSAELPPGVYVAKGKDGEASCLSARFSVASGLRTPGPALPCQGF